MRAKGKSPSSDGVTGDGEWVGLPGTCCQKESYQPPTAPGVPGVAPARRLSTPLITKVSTAAPAMAGDENLLSCATSSTRYCVKPRRASFTLLPFANASV